MIIRNGTIEDLKKLKWAWEDNYVTQKMFIDNINKEKQEFLVLELDGKLIGEIHIVWKSKDVDEADGKNRAYLCAYRIHPSQQGKKYGKALMEKTIERIKEKGFKEISLGVVEFSGIKYKLVQMYKKYIKKDTYNHIEFLKTLYEKWGFKLLYYKYVNNFDLHKSGLPKKQKIALFKKKIG